MATPKHVLIVGLQLQLIDFPGPEFLGRAEPACQWPDEGAAVVKPTRITALYLLAAWAGVGVERNARSART